MLKPENCTVYSCLVSFTCLSYFQITLKFLLGKSMMHPVVNVLLMCTTSRFKTRFRVTDLWIDYAQIMHWFLVEKGSISY